MIAMTVDALSGPARALLLVCAAAAAMESLTRDENGAATFRSLCALAVAVGAYRVVAGLLGA